MGVEHEQHVPWTDALDTIVSLEERFYFVSEGNGTLEVCVIATGQNVSINISILPINNTAQGRFEWYLVKLLKWCHIKKWFTQMPTYIFHPLDFQMYMQAHSMFVCPWASTDRIQIQLAGFSSQCKLCTFSSSNFLTISALPFSAAYLPSVVQFSSMRWHILSIRFLFVTLCTAWLIASITQAGSPTPSGVGSLLISFEYCKSFTEMWSC